MPITLDGTTGIILSGAAGLSQTGDGELTLGNTLDVASGGTGTNTLIGIVKGDGSNALTAGKVDLATEISGTLNVASGGTGANSLTGVVKASGTNAFTAGVVNLTTEVGGVLNVASGGTGLTSVGTSGNVLTSDGTSWVSQALPPPSAGSIQAVASGTLADGTKVILNANGTVSAISTTLVSPPTVDTLSTFSTVGNSVCIGFDSDKGKILVLYTDASSYLMATIGTISGESISFSTPITVNNARTWSDIASIAYHPIEKKFLIFVREAASPFSTYYFVATVISETSVSFSSPVVWSAISNNAAYRLEYIGSSVNKFCIVGNGSLYLITLSGDSVSFGSAQSLTSTIYDFCYDTANDKLVCFGYNVNSYPRVAVGTISGTIISFGTQTVVESITVTGFNACSYDAASGKIVLAWRRSTNGYYYATVGTVSGTNISVGTIVQFSTGSSATPVLIYDFPSSTTFVGNDFSGLYSTTISGTTISFGTALASADMKQHQIIYAPSTKRIYFIRGGGIRILYRIKTYTTTLNQTNFIGISNGIYSNGQIATIQTIGSIDDAQTGLTPGLKYYVQSDGSLSTITNFESPLSFAGTALSSTKLLIKG